MDASRRGWKPGRRALKIYIVLGALMIVLSLYLAATGSQLTSNIYVLGLGGAATIIWSLIDLAKLKKSGVPEPVDEKSIPAHIRSWFVVEKRPEEHQHEEEEEEEVKLRDRIISIRTMQFPLRLLVGLAFAQIIASVLLVGLRDSLGKSPQTWLLPQSADQGPHISTLVLVACVLFIILGFTFVTAGAFSARIAARAWLTVILIALYLIFLIVAKIYGASLSIYTVTFILYSCLSGGLLAYYYRTYGPVKQRPWLLWTGTICAAVLPPTIVWFGLPITVVETIVDIGLILVYLFLLAGTDWAEMADDFSKWMTRQSYSSYSVWLPATVAVLAVLNLSLVVHRHGLGTIAILPGFAIFAVAMIAILRIANFRSGWSTHMSPGVMALFVIGFLVLQDIAYTYGDVSARDLFCAIVATGMAVLLVWLSRTGRAKWIIPPALFVLLLALMVFVSPIASLEAAIRGTQVAFNPVYSDGPLTVVGLCTLSVMGFLALKRPPLAKHSDALKLLVGLNVAVLLLYGLSVFVYGYATETRDKVSWTEAAILFIALSWDILFSGHHITNREGWLFPRQSKVLLFFGYATLTATSVLFWTSIQDAPQLRTLIERGSDPEHFVQLGISVLGPSLLICLSILRLGPPLFSVAGVPHAHAVQVPSQEPPSWKRALPVLLPLTAVALLFWLPFQDWSEPKGSPEDGQHESAEAKARFDQGARLWKAGDQVGATKPFLAAAQAGYAPAQLQIGWQYEKGIGLPQSYVEAARWYRAAADRGQPQAMSNLALLYEMGEGVPEDWVASAKWRQRSAQLGNVYGEAALGRAYQFGIGVPQNRQLAIEWDERAARQGDQNSAYFTRWLANPRNAVGFRTASEKDLLAARFGSAERIPAVEPRGIRFHNSNERMAWLLRQQANQPVYTNRRPPSQRTDCCPCGPQMSDAQCFMKCNALIPRCPY